MKNKKIFIFIFHLTNKETIFISHVLSEKIPNKKFTINNSPLFNLSKIIKNIKLLGGSYDFCSN